MFNQGHKSISLRIALVLVLIAGTFGVIPAHASAVAAHEAVFASNIFNKDGTLKLDGSAPASFQADSWDMQLGPERSPVFSPKNRETFSPLSITTIGNWSALGSNLAGTDGALSLSLYPSLAGVYDIAVVGTDVYVAGCFTDAGGDPTADYVAKWDGVHWSGLGNDGRIPADGAVQGCVKAIAISGNDIYIGTFGGIGVGNYSNPLITGFAKWDGTTWSGIGGDGLGGSSIVGPVFSIAITGSDIAVIYMLAGILQMSRMA